MKKILLFALAAFMCIGFADAAVRDNNAVARVKSAGAAQSGPSRSAAMQNVPDRVVRAAAASAAPRTASNAQTGNSSRAAAATGTVSRSAAPTAVTARTTSAAPNGRRAATAPAATTTTATARAAADTTATAMTETRTGAEYERCKTSYFACMDQFCSLKNDDYKRCSCSDRVYDLTDVRTVLQDANEKLTTFTENLDTVGMTGAQATAMRIASEGENALTADGSSSKALLQAIMNSISGGDTNVGGKYSDLNRISLSFDTTNAFGINDAGQVIASYNGRNLYNAIYGQCRNAVRADCNDASLQRAVTAYLMAVEQDCNTVQTFINESQKKMTAAVREGGAMLDLARVENRQKHNSDDMTACLNNVEAAVLSEEVCGAGYHKCLDNGEFIDITTGSPITGVIDFYKLEQLLTYNNSASVADQKLSKISNNRTFVQNFEKRVKKFAEPALDKCAETADDVWADYLDKAMIDIYYAQRSKVSEIRQGCFDFVSACYMNGDTALTAAMAELIGDSNIVLQPDKIALNTAICSDYVTSCDRMFDDGGGIVEQYVKNRESSDVLTACRAVAKQCFDKYGGTNYENFYYPNSGLFYTKKAPDWFTLYNKDGELVSECAKQLNGIESCKGVIEQAFGGFDYLCNIKDDGTLDADGCDYGMLKDSTVDGLDKDVDKRALRSTGVATEVYYQIIDSLKTQCTNVQGRFVELQFLKTDMYGKDINDGTGNNICLANFSNLNGSYYDFTDGGMYGVTDGEDMCPRGYRDTVDVDSWGACLCFENGARRSRWGASVKCVAELPVYLDTEGNDKPCTYTYTGTDGAHNHPADDISGNNTNYVFWCTQGKLSSKNQVCPHETETVSNGACIWSDMNSINVGYVPEGL